MRVIIAGGGTGGLAAAIALRKAGLEPLVLEQAPAFTAIGAGLGLYANAMKALTYLGADAYWRQNAARIDVSEQRALADDEIITASSLEPGRRNTASPTTAGTAPTCMTSLLMALPPECVRTGSRVVGFEETARDVRVELAERRGDPRRPARRRGRPALGHQEAADGRAGGPVHRRRRLARADPAGKGAKRATTRRSCPGSDRAATCCFTRSGTTGTPDSVYSLSAFVPVAEVRP